MEVDGMSKAEKVLMGQIIQVRDTGLTNMFDVHAVQKIAFDRGLFELVDFLADRGNYKAYAQVIMTGKFA